MVRFVSDGIELAYDDSGGTERDAVVLLHGLGSASLNVGSHRSGADQTVGRVLPFDQRGHGESSHASGTYTLEHYLDTIVFCESIAAHPVVLVGHSLGGVVAASVARTRPDLVPRVVARRSPMYRGDPAEAHDNPFLAVFALLHQLVARHPGPAGTA